MNFLASKIKLLRIMSDRTTRWNRIKEEQNMKMSLLSGHINDLQNLKEDIFSNFDNIVVGIEQDPFETNNYLRRGTKAHKRNYSPFVRELSSFNTFYSPFAVLHKPNLIRNANILNNKFSFLGVFDKYSGRTLPSSPFRYHRQSFVFNNRESPIKDQVYSQIPFSRFLVEHAQDYQNSENFF